MKGRIKKYIDTKGFGFITGDDNADYFFHVTSVKSAVQPTKGAIVEFVSGTSPKGLTATDVFVEEQKTLPTFVTFGDVRVKLSNIKNYGISTKRDSYCTKNYNHEQCILEQFGIAEQEGNDDGSGMKSYNREFLDPPTYWQKVYQRKNKKSECIHTDTFIPIAQETAIKIMTGNGQMAVSKKSLISGDDFIYIDKIASKDDVIIKNEVALRVCWKIVKYDYDENGEKEKGSITTNYAFVFYPDGAKFSRKEKLLGSVVSTNWVYSTTDEKLDIEELRRENEIISTKED